MARPYYFAYGSNLHPLRLRLRTPSARLFGRAQLRGHRLRFHKRGRDGSAKCDAWRTGRSEDVVHGVVYRVARRDRLDLDRAEDLGRGYDRVRRWVSVNGRTRAVFTYVARPEAIVDDLMPFDWYLGYVLRGARHQGLPGAYVSGLDRVESLRDEDGGRRRRNRRVMLRSRPFRRR
ncbi:MAG: gamma-glutamylcyclotransferase family protein [Pseudomonadota bacterium]|nr:gamma-glutamylcyclotransferase family protein [Pseudomonadota bacterium]